MCPHDARARRRLIAARVTLSTRAPGIGED
jgi:hypothetical protein